MHSIPLIDLNRSPEEIAAYSKALREKGDKAFADDLDKAAEILTTDYEEVSRSISKAALGTWGTFQSK